MYIINELKRYRKYQEAFQNSFLYLSNLEENVPQNKEEFMTKIRGRPISFLECVLKEYATPQGYTTMMTLNYFSKKDWRDLNVDVDSEKIL